MKRFLFQLVLMLEAFSVYGQECNINGDTNRDGSVDVADIVAIVNIICGQSGCIPDTHQEKPTNLIPNSIDKVLTSFSEDIEIKGNSIGLKPLISIIDDDAIDYQIPSSCGIEEVDVKSTRGGYFSCLVPLLLSLGDKYSKKLVCGIAAEGHRIGLTTFKTDNDDYSELNENGKLLNILSNHGFEVLNHSMTAQLPQKTFVVESINSDLADKIYKEGSGTTPLSFQNTIVLDKSTGRWYEKNNEQATWMERIPTKKYALPFYMDYNSGVWHINRDFDFDYNWGEWIKRANELGLKYVDFIVHNGSTTHPFTIANSRKYAKA